MWNDLQRAMYMSSSCNLIDAKKAKDAIIKLRDVHLRKWEEFISSSVNLQ